MKRAVQYMGDRRRGATLIEMIAAIAVLTLGILVLLKVFPGGFFVVRMGENRTLANALARQELERWKNNATSLPAGILGLFPDANGVIAYDSSISPDRLTLTEAETQRLQQFGLDPYYFDGVNRFRRIMAEKVRIPVPSPAQYGSGITQGSVYVLGAGPVYYLQTVENGELVSNITVHGAPMMRRRWRTNAGEPYFTDRQVYAIDYDANNDDGSDDTIIWLATQPFDRRFTITFDYWFNGRLESVQKSIPVPSGAPGEMVRIDLSSWQEGPGKPPILEAGWQMRWGSEQLSRQFRQLDLQDWSGDPYEFRLISPNIAPFANMGVLMFNPLGRDFVERTARGTIPLQAHINYDVLDWHIIRDDRLIPSAPTNVKLTLGSVLSKGSRLDDNTVYQGLVHGVSHASNPDFVAINLDNGQTLNQDPDNPDYRVDYTAGVVRVLNPELRQSNLRFFYQASGNWAAQVVKPYELYSARLHPNISWKEYYVGDSNPDQPGVGSPKRIYFSLSEAGKSVLLEEVHIIDANGEAQTLDGITAQISKSPEVGGINLCYIDLSSASPTGLQRLDSSVYGYAVRNVRGASLRARVVWREQGALRRSELETVLMREAE